MLHAATMLTGLWALWMTLTQRWDGGGELGLGLVAALTCVLTAARFGGLSSSTFSPGILALTLRHLPAVFRGALATLRAAVAADITLRPALVRIKPRPSSDSARASFAGLISAAPGTLVVEADADGLLVHVLNEDSVDAREISNIEERVLAVLRPELRR